MQPAGNTVEENSSVGLRNPNALLAFGDAVGWVAGRASGL